MSWIRGEGGLSPLRLPSTALIFPLPSGSSWEILSVSTRVPSSHPLTQTFPGYFPKGSIDWGGGKSLNSIIIKHCNAEEKLCSAWWEYTPNRVHEKTCTCGCIWHTEVQEWRYNRSTIIWLCKERQVWHHTPWYKKAKPECLQMEGISAIAPCTLQTFKWVTVL